MFMHKRNAIEVPNDAVTAVNIGFSFTFKGCIFELTHVYSGSGTSILYRFHNNGAQLFVHTAPCGRTGMTYLNHGEGEFEESGDIRWLKQNGNTYFTIEQGMLCEVVKDKKYNYNDSVQVGTTLEYHARDGVKSLTILMVGKDGALVCENHKGETVTVRKNELTVAENYDIIWQE